MQSAIEEFAHKPGADGRSRGSDREAEEEEEVGGGDEPDIKSNNPHPTDTWLFRNVMVGISRSKVIIFQAK